MTSQSISDTSSDVDIEELHDHRVTFTIRMEEPCEEYIGFFEDAEQVDYVERLDEANYLITKTSWGVLCRRPKPRCPPTTESRLRGPSRLYRSLLPPRGSPGHDRGFQSDRYRDAREAHGVEESKSMLTDRQLEVVTCAPEEGYFEWPRRSAAKNSLTSQKSTERRRSNTSGKPSQSSLTSAIEENTHLQGHGEP